MNKCESTAESCSYLGTCQEAQGDGDPGAQVGPVFGPHVGQHGPDDLPGIDLLQLWERTNRHCLTETPWEGK